MGLFDTFVFDTPISCLECGAKIPSTQSKAFEPCLDTYRTGDAIRACRIHSGIVEEECYCFSGSAKLERKKTPAWIVIWHGIYAGAYSTIEAAEARQGSVDRLTMLEWHLRQQSEKEAWRRRFRSLYSTLLNWHDYNLAEDKEAFLKKPWALFHGDLDTYAKAADPLAAILMDHENPKDADDGTLDE